MPSALVITPVKDSIETTMETIEAIYHADGNHAHVVYNDFSTPENKKILEDNQVRMNYELVHLEDITEMPSPNYRLILQHAQKRALIMNLPMIIVESDVIVKKDTINQMIAESKLLSHCGLLGSITTDESGTINFPYLNFKDEGKSIDQTRHSLSFCCTLLSVNLLKEYSFQELKKKKDWFDVFISKKSRKLGFHNYIAFSIPVVHKPHSSRPWKQLKYTSPLKYYLYKLIKRKDKI